MSTCAGNTITTYNPFQLSITCILCTKYENQKHQILRNNLFMKQLHIIIKPNINISRLLQLSPFADSCLTMVDGSISCLLHHFSLPETKQNDFLKNPSEIITLAKKNL